MASKSTPITIRVQAKDGMFLGPDSYNGAIITIKNSKTGKVLAEGLTNNGDSGSRDNNFSSAASHCPITTPSANSTSGAQIFWVIASDSTVAFNAELDLAEATLLEVSVQIPLPAEQEDQIVSNTQWVIPGQNINNTPGIVIEVPGLWVEPAVIVGDDIVKIKAKVTMMCGCEINEGEPWIPEDFEVYAQVEGIDEKIPLSFIENSQFSGELSIEKAGDYTVTVFAAQHSSINMGVAKTVIQVK